jgi:hypothetical protein
VIAFDELDEYPVHAFIFAKVYLSLDILVHKNVGTEPKQFPQQAMLLLRKSLTALLDKIL